MTDAEFDDEPNAGLRKTLIASIGGVIILFLSAFLAGYTVAMLEHGMPTLTDAAIVGGILFSLACVALCGWKVWPKGNAEPLSTSTRKSRNWFYILLAVSSVFGVYLAISDGLAIDTLLSNKTIDPTVAMISLFVWLVVLPLIGWMWWKNVDEHEEKVYREGAFWSLNAYMLVVPAWWMAARAGWVPQQDPMFVFAVISLLWSAIWLYRRYA